MGKRCMGCMEIYGDEFEVCPHCGYVEGTQAEEAIHMDPGTLLHNRYIIGRVLGYGGFGVTYLGWDGRLEQKVAIKEYLPSEFSTRMPGRTSVTIFNGDKAEQFKSGLDKFVEEAKRLAKFQNEPGIVKVFDSFSENETAYIIMEFLNGETLSQRLKRYNTIPEDEAVEMLTPVMNSLEVVHNAGILHRDIAPDNIFITKSGDVKLIDFGASRFATTSHSRSLTVIIKPGYSPEEQYRSRGDQGPHTDVYALAATLYKMMTGKTPPDAIERRAKIENQKKEILEEPHKLNKKISLRRENAILNAMNVRIEDRTPDVKTFLEELNAEVPVKRRYGKIKKIDLYSWPLWLKLLIPAALAACIIFGALLMTGVIEFKSLFSSSVEVPEGMVVVPDVEGMDKDEALAELTDNMLTPSPEGNVESEYIEAGKIVIQSPVGGSYIETNGKVILTVSSGNGVVTVQDGIATVPYVIWDTKEDALTKLSAAGLGEPTILEAYDDNVAAGKVISQSIEEGTQVEEGYVITLTISLGTKSFEMPNVVGNKTKTAESTLTELGLVVSKEYQNSDSVEEGKIISQSIASGQTVTKGTTVTLIISSGKADTATQVSTTQASTTPASTKAAAKSYTLTFDPNGGTTPTSSISLTEGSEYGQLPTPTKDYCTFKGWFTSSYGGTQISASTKMGSANTTVYAQWRENDLSDWVLASKVPSGATIEQRKWTYTKTETKESTESSLSGWTKTGNYWKETGSGTRYYADFPSGYNTGDSLYSTYSHGALSSYEDSSSKRTVSGSSYYTHIYWHWTYPLADYNSRTYNRLISDTYNEWLSGGGYATLWYAFESTSNYSYNSSYGLYKAEISAYAASSYWWFRFDVYSQTYTDYTKYYQYKKVTNNLESSTKVTSGGNISNVKEYVKYRAK